VVRDEIQTNRGRAELRRAVRRRPTRAEGQQQYFEDDMEESGGVDRTCSAEPDKERARLLLESYIKHDVLTKEADVAWAIERLNKLAGLSPDDPVAIIQQLARTIGTKWKPGTFSHTIADTVLDKLHLEASGEPYLKELLEHILALKSMNCLEPDVRPGAAEHLACLMNIAISIRKAIVHGVTKDRVYTFVRDSKATNYRILSARTLYLVYAILPHTTIGILLLPLMGLDHINIDTASAPQLVALAGLLSTSIRCNPGKGLQPK
jgi:hypothetical protein